jgi:MinD superfamily P-loop ATPase
MVHAKLGIAEENSGKLVTLIRQKARELAQQQNLNLILTDGPPGIGCPVIASIGGASGVLIVAEPTVSGKHDMDRVIQLAEHFKIPAMICINKADLNPEVSLQIKDYAQERDLTFLGEIPFDPTFTYAMVQAKTVFEYDMNSNAAVAARQLWDKTANFLEL